MAEKVVSVRLQARVEGFTAGMRKAKASVDDLTKADVPKAAKAYSDLANKAALAGGAIALGLGVAAKRFADFDAAMSAVKANTNGTVSEMEKLRKAAIELGADSQFTATEAAQGINELGKAGVKTADILNGGLKGSLDLAAAGQIGVAQAAETTASALTQFGLKGDNAVHVADLLASGANKAQGGVGDLGAALNQAGLVAAATGLSLEETTAGLTAFASAGLIGSDAGTSFKTMLQRLSAPSGEAATTMAELGINAYDAQGNFVGLAEVAGQLRAGMEDLTPAQRNAAMATIFGSDAVRASNILYEQGADGIRKWITEVNDQGAAARQAATLTDNLSGDLERLGGAFDSALIQTGSGANSALRTMVQGLTGLVDVVAKVPGPVLLAGTGLAAIALIVPKGISAFKNYTATLDSLGLSMDKISARGPRAAAAVGAVGRAAKVGAAAAAAAAVAYAAFGDDIEGIGTNTLAGDLLDTAGAMDALNKRFADNASLNGFDSGVTDFGAALRAAFDPSTMEQVDRGLGAIKGFFGGTDVSNIAIAGQRLTELDSALSGMVASGNVAGAQSALKTLTDEAAKQGVTADQLMTKLPGVADALAGVDNAAGPAAGSSGAMADATADMRTEAEKADDALNALKDALDGLGSPAAQARAAQREFQGSINDTNSALETYRDTLIAKAEADGKSKKAAEEWADSQIAAGRAMTDTSDEALTLQGALDGIRQATLDKVLADFQLTGSTESATAAMEKGRDAFIKAATQAGLAEDEAGKLADQLGLIPDNVKILVSQSGAQAAGAAIDRAARDRFATVWVDRRYRDTDFSSTFQGVGGRAAGGPIWGAGTKTSDSVPIWASTGEFMQKAAAVDKYGLSFMHAVNSLQFPKDLARGYATGGPIQPQFAPRMQVVTVPAGPSMHSQTFDQPINIGTLVSSDVRSFRREAEMRRNAAYAANRGAS